MSSPHYTNPGNFPAWELTFSETATRRGIVNEPDARQWRLLSLGAAQGLQPARDALGPLRITSGYRCSELNRAIGGSAKSDHMIRVTPKGSLVTAVAFDIVPLRVSMTHLFFWLWQKAPWARLIWEYGRWVHMSLDPENGPPENREMYLMEAVRRRISTQRGSRWRTEYQRRRPTEFKDTEGWDGVFDV